MKINLSTLVAIILMAQATLALPTVGGDNRPTHSHFEKIINFVLSKNGMSENIISSLPHIETKLGTCFKKLSFKMETLDVLVKTKSDTSERQTAENIISTEDGTTSDVTKSKNLNLGFKNKWLTAPIDLKMPVSESPTIANTISAGNEVDFRNHSTLNMELSENPLTHIYNQLLEEEIRSKNINSKINSLNHQLIELMYQNYPTDAQKAKLLLTSMVEWDEHNDGELFDKELKETLEEQHVKDVTFLKLLVEYTRLKEFYFKTLENKSNNNSLLSTHLLGSYLEAFRAENEEVIAKIYEQSSPTTSEVLELETTTTPITDVPKIEDETPEKLFEPILDKMLKSSGEQRTKDMKIKYLDKQVDELKYCLYLSDTQRAVMLVINMMEWDEMYNHESFVTEVNKIFADIYSEEQTMPRLLTEYLRLRKLYAEMLKSDQSSLQALSLEQLGRYLDEFKVDASLMPGKMSTPLSSQKARTYNFWRQCLISSCKDETFWKILS